MSDHLPDPGAAFRRGVTQALPFIIVVVPFALLFGVVSQEAGLSLIETMAFSVVVFAGASQFVALQLMQEQAPLVVVLATALAVNLRMVMYSAAMAPHFGPAGPGLRAALAYFLVDQTFAASAAEFERRPHLTLPEKVAFFFGAIAPVAPSWYLASLSGALMGRTIPPGWALDFAVPITFLAVVAPMLRSAAHVAAAAVSVAATLALWWMPFGTGLLLAAPLAMLAGVATEIALQREAAMTDAQLWTVILLLGAGTFLIRWSFLGGLGGRAMPPWMERGLRYTAVAVIPGLVAPAVLWPAATGGTPDPARIGAALATLLAGLILRNTLGAILAGGATLYLLLWLFPG